jgi:hypothetical protein
MGLVYADIELANAKNGSLKSMVVKALVDTGAMTLCIPEHIAIQLQLQEIEKRESLRRTNVVRWCRMSARSRSGCESHVLHRRSRDRGVRANGCRSDGGHGPGYLSLGANGYSQSQESEHSISRGEVECYMTAKPKRYGGHSAHNHVCRLQEQLNLPLVIAPELCGAGYFFSTASWSYC